jgi:hypothetical protein
LKSIMVMGGSMNLPKIATNKPLPKRNAIKPTAHNTQLESSVNVKGLKMPKYTIREGDGNEGTYRRGEVEAPNAFDALRLARRQKLIFFPRDVTNKNIEGDNQNAHVASYVAPIYGDACRWCAEAIEITLTDQRD